MIKREPPTGYCHGQGKLDDAFIKRKEPDQQNDNQREHENPLIPAQSTGGQFHYFTEKQAPQC
jgi:hypothetical protein